MIKILIVEDELAISRLLQINLEDAGFIAQMALEGNRALKLINTEKFDLILLDIMLPIIDGFELLEYIKPLGIPVIMVSAKGQTKDKVKGLKCGADDYITKPFEVSELIARINSVLRRTGKLENYLEIDDLKIDFNSRSVFNNNQKIDLTTKEYELLVLLIQNKNTALFRDMIFDKIWGYEYDCDTRTLDLHISRLRQKLGWKDKIITIRKFGYRLEI